MPGYSLAVIENIVLDEKFKEILLCLKCNLVLKAAKQLFCGHRCCSTCLDEIKELTSAEFSSCPKCGAPIDRGQLNSIIEDKGFLRDHGTFEMSCPNFGCGEKVKYKELEKHLSTCQYSKKKCERIDCTEMVGAKDMEIHMAEHCLYREVNCQQCNTKLIAAKLKLHITDECPALFLSCPHCGARLRDGEMEHHLNFVCRFAWRSNCPYECRPTDEEPWTKDSLSQHRKDMQADHLDKVMGILHNFSEDNLKKLRDFPQGLQNGLHRSSDQEQQQQQYNESVQGVAGDYPRISGREYISELKRSTGDHYELGALLGLHEKTFADLLLLPNKITHIGDDNKMILQTLLRVKRDLAVKTLEIERIQSTLNEMQTASFSGSLTWRIDKYSEIMNRAKQGLQTDVYSPIFFAGKFGYKMRVVLYPNGAAAVAGQHMSIYLMILPGDYDPILKWPFNRRITFVLEDQDFKKPIADTFMRTIPHPGVFGSREGSERFTLLNALTPGHTKNDVMFIRCTVDCLDMPFV